MDKGGLGVTWYDHHDPGGPIAHPALALNINQAPETCTAVIVNAVTGHNHPLWAAMGAYGDNLSATASALASAGGASSHEAALLRRVGVLLNYNAYGDEPGDALFDAAEIAARMAPIASALDFCWEPSIIAPLAAQLRRGPRALPRARSPGGVGLGASAFLVPDEAFARRYGATWANERVMQKPGEALAVLHPRKDGTYTVSIRSPRDWRAGSARLQRIRGGADRGRSERKGAKDGEGAVPSAAELAKEFPTGGGRKLAAGIDVVARGSVGAFYGSVPGVLRLNVRGRLPRQSGLEASGQIVEDSR